MINEDKKEETLRRRDFLKRAVGCVVAARVPLPRSSPQEERTVRVDCVYRFMDSLGDNWEQCLIEDTYTTWMGVPTLPSDEYARKMMADLYRMGCDELSNICEESCRI